jgi:hypothetical protein
LVVVDTVVEVAEDLAAVAVAAAAVLEVVAAVEAGDDNNY